MFFQRASTLGFHPSLPSSFLPLLLRFRDHVGPSFGPLLQWIPPTVPASVPTLAVPLSPLDPCHATQKWWSAAYFSVLPDRIAASLPLRDRLRLKLQAQPHSTAWMDVVSGVGPVEAYPPRDYRTLLRWWLGLPLFPGDSAQLCPFCHDAMDSFGDHLVSCKHNKLTERHHDVRRALAKSCNP
jgi:hypothetical protein